MARPLSPMNARIENFIRAEARGEPHDQILREQFGITADSDPKDKARAEQKMYHWRHRPDADAIWQDELKAVVRRCVPNAANRIKHQVDSDTEWLANKAANDVITLASRIGVIKTEETTTKVEITGMPDMGTPEDDG